MMEYPFKDLLPLDEVLEREGYYKDWTHLDPEVFYSLTQISEYIKTKGYGVDVRLLIAQLAEHFSLKTAQINQIELFFNDVMQELAEDKDYHSLPEIAGARGGFNTLGERLNETTAQLAHKVDKGNVSVSDINKNLGKLDQTFMTEEFLQQMAGNTPINAVPADGSLTTQKYAEESVTAGKTDFIKIYKNLYNENTATSGGLPNHATGEIYPTQGVMSDFIPVIEGEYYYQGKDENRAFYDSEGDFIIGTTNAQASPFRVPAGMNIAFMKVGFRDNVPKSQRMVVRGTSLPPMYLAYNETYNENGFKIYKEDIESGAIDYSKTDFIAKVTNLFNKDTAISGGVPDFTNGGTYPSSTSHTSDFIPVKPDTQYSTTELRTIAFYDENENFIYGMADDSSRIIQTDKDPRIALMKVGIWTSDLENTMIIEGDTLPRDYITYGDTRLLIDEELMKEIKLTSNISGLKWNALGDSITQGVGTTKSYVDYIVESTGVEVRNYGISGTMISSVPVSYGVGMSIRYADMDDDADIITVFGGTNDYGHGTVEIGSWEDTGSETMYGGTKTLVKGLMSKYPTSKIGFILPIPRHGLNGSNNLGDYVNVIKDVCDRYSIPTLDLYHGSGLMPGKDSPHQGVLFNGTDNTHPNAAGHKIIATKIQRFLESL